MSVGEIVGLGEGVGVAVVVVHASANVAMLSESATAEIMVVRRVVMNQRSTNFGMSNFGNPAASCCSNKS